MKLKKLLPLLLFAPLFFSPKTAYSGQEEVYSVFKFGGLDTDTNPLFLSEDRTPDSQNVITDDGPGLGPRKGFVSFSTETASAQGWVFSPSNGTKYHIIRVGGNLLATTGSGTYDVTVGTVSSSVDSAGTQFGDRFYFTNTVDGLKYWNMSSVTTVDASLAGDSLVAHKGRLWLSGVAGAPRTIYISKFSDGDTWTAADETGDEADSIQVGGGLDERVNGLFSSHNNLVYYFRNNSFGGVYGNRYGGFVLRVFSDDVGTAYPESAVDCDGNLRFLGPRYSVYEWNGAVLKKISEPIDNLMETVSQGDASLRSFTFTSEADFDTGTNFDSSNSLTAGSIVMSTWTATDENTADFELATASSSVRIADGKVYLSTNNVNVTNNGFEDALGALYASQNGWTRTSAFWSRSSAEAYAGSYSLTFQSSGYEYLITDPNNSALSSTIESNPSGSWTAVEIDVSDFVGRFIKIRFSNQTGTRWTFSDSFLCSGNTITFYEKLGSGNYIYIDGITGGRSSITSGTFTSQSFDTTFSTAVYSSDSSATYTESGHSIAFITQNSTDSVTWTGAGSWTPGVNVPGGDAYNYRYIRYGITISTGGSTDGTALPYLDDVTFIARSGHGTWLSPAIDTRDMSAWGIFSENSTLDDGTISYAVYTDTDTSMSMTNGVPDAGVYVSSQSVTDATIPTISTVAYFRLHADLSTTTYDPNPSVEDMSIEWNEGSTLFAPGIWMDQRYWLFVAINSFSNNRVLVYDKNRDWQLYSGINGVWAGIYNSYPTFGNTSGIFVAESGETDNGTSIASYYKTKDFALAGVDTKFYLNNVRMTTAEAAGETLGTEFFVNGRLTGTSLGNMAMDGETGLNIEKLPIPMSGTQVMRTTALKWSVTGSSSWKLLLGNMYYEKEPIPW